MNVGIGVESGQAISNGWPRTFVLALVKFTADTNAMRSWGDILRAVFIFVVMVVLGITFWDEYFPYGKPVVGVKTLNGCYEGVGLPDIIRPPQHWAFSVHDKVISDRSGNQVSTIRLGPVVANSTRITFSPGILVAGKPQDVSVGETVGGRAYFKRGTVRIAVPDETGDLMQKTSCD